MRGAVLMLTVVLGLAGCNKPETPRMSPPPPDSAGEITAPAPPPHAPPLAGTGVPLPDAGASTGAPVVAPATPPGTAPVTGLSTPPDTGGVGTAATTK